MKQSEWRGAGSREQDAWSMEHGGRRPEEVEKWLKAGEFFHIPVCVFPVTRI